MIGMSAIDLEFTRSQFPAFSEPSLQGFAHFENAGGSYACGQAIEWLERYYRCTKVQPYHDFPPSQTAGEQMDAARQRMADWLNVGSDELHFGPSTRAAAGSWRESRKSLNCPPERSIIPTGFCATTATCLRPP